MLYYVLGILVFASCTHHFSLHSGCCQWFPLKGFYRCFCCILHYGMYYMLYHFSVPFVSSRFGLYSHIRSCKGEKKHCSWRFYVADIQVFQEVLPRCYCILTTLYKRYTVIYIFFSFDLDRCGERYRSDTDPRLYTTVWHRALEHKVRPLWVHLRNLMGRSVRVLCLNALRNLFVSRRDENSIELRFWSVVFAIAVRMPFSSPIERCLSRSSI